MIGPISRNKTDETQFEADLKTWPVVTTDTAGDYVRSQKAAGGMHWKIVIKMMTIFS